MTDGGRQQPKEYLDQDIVRKVFDLSMVRRILGYAGPYRWLGWAAFASLVAGETIPFLYPLILKEVLDGPAVTGEWSRLWHFAALYLGLTALHAVLLYVRTVSSQNLGLKVVHDLRVDLFRHVLGLELRFFHRTPVGRLMTRMTNDVDTLNTLFTQGLIDLMSSLLMLVLAAVFMLWQDWRLGLATLAFLPAMAYATHVFRVRVRDINTVIRKELAALNSNLQESLSGMHLVQLFGKGNTRYESFRESNRRYTEAYKVNVRYYSWFFPIINTLSEAAILVCYLFGAWLAIHGDLSIGTLAAFAWYASVYNRPLRDISDKITNLQSAMAAGDRVLHLLDTHAALPDGRTALSLTPPQITFTGVSFHYDPERPVLEDISFEVPAGTTTAIVGATGSGKSTILTLLNRHYLPQSGSIRFDGGGLEQATNTSLRRLVSNVTQDIVLFSATLKDNILMGESFDEARFHDACARARVDQIAASMPHGYDTFLGNSGRELSTGQRQLLAFARALYADPGVLLLDEATASIDTETERLVQQAVLELLQGRTSIVVAHRLSTIVNADQILVLHHGRIRERGRHEELLALDGIYSRLHRLQTS